MIITIYNAPINDNVNNVYKIDSVSPDTKMSLEENSIRITFLRDFGRVY